MKINSLAEKIASAALEEAEVLIKATSKGTSVEAKNWAEAAKALAETAKAVAEAEKVAAED